jgi:PadR family transcriptional regulator PadR
MAKGDHLGEFEHLVMLALLRLKGDAYGMRVRREIQGRTERSVTIGSVYATLERLERKGFVVSTVGGQEPSRGRHSSSKVRDSSSKGRARRYFGLTPAGAKALLRKQDAIQRMTEGLSLRRELGTI